MKPSVERILWTGVVALAIIGSVAGGLGYVTIERLQEQQRNVTSTHELFGVLDDLVIEVQAAESGFANDILADQVPSAESVRTSAARTDGEVAFLRLRLQHDSPEFQDLDILARDVPAKLKNIQDGIVVLPTQGAAAAAAFVLSGDGARLMDSVRATAGRIVDREQRELVDRQARTDRAARDAEVAMFALAGLGTLMLGGGAAWARFGLAVRHRAAAANALFGAVVNASPDAIVTRDSSGHITTWNPGAERLFGLRAKEALGQPAIVVVPELARLPLWANTKKVTAPSETISAELVRLSRSGASVDVLVTEFAVDTGRDAAIVHDVTDQKRADDAVREAQARLQAILDNSLAVVYVKDPEGRYTIVNRQFEVDVERPASELVGLTAYDLFPKPAADIARERELRVIESGTPQEWEEVVPLPHGERTFLANGFPLHFSGSSGPYFCGVYLDITERKQIELALVEATAAALVANRAKSEFLSRMSHELRTPLNVILGFGQILQLDELSPDHEEAVGHILDSGRELLGLVDEVLDIARVESGRVSMALKPTAVEELVRDVLELVEPLARQYEVRLDTFPEPDGSECWVNADSQRLKQVLLNLVSNSLKYNHPGGSVSIRCEAARDGNTRVLVTDTGWGIAPAKIGRLFSPFDRLGAETTDVAGTGLGLALSKRLVEAMGGTIGVESTVGAGSTFWVELASIAPAPHGQPQGDAAANDVGQTLAPPTGARSILYIEDNLSNLKLVEHLLNRWPNTRLIPAMQGQTGLDLARQHQPNLIVLDLNLPDLPGEEVLRQLKADPKTRDIPVIVASADAMPEQVARLKKAGAIDYFTKPFDISKFLLAVGAALGRTDLDDPRGSA